ncbi:MAG: helix-turn-helix transcriptional regulator, partial [Pseudomonadota bacterium]
GALDLHSARSQVDFAHLAALAGHAGLDPAPVAGAHTAMEALERAGLIEKDDEGQRPIYRLAPQALAAPRGWLDRFARFWDGALDRLEDYIAEMDAAGEDDDDPAAPEDGPEDGPDDGPGGGPDDGPGGGPGGGEDPSGAPPARSSKRQGDA